ncbi:hypothetical protein [uncultured Deinococcus sp.]|uniref:hypothetical protein n=1 Tax=uncultured Deinococcus sp. TaxID=158789 RepID=UPI0025E7A642|nr:hypothetical protein [uncultured Deinococcus sp.]
MKVNEQELLLTIEATLTEFLPLPEVLEPTYGGRIGNWQLGQWRHGAELTIQQAWESMRHPDFPGKWLVIPLCGGRLVLAERDAVPPEWQAMARLWHERAAGMLALVWGAGCADA